MSVTGINDDDDKWQGRIAAASPSQLNALLLQEAAAGDLERVQDLLALGADLNHDNGRALTRAASRAPAAMTAYLLKRGITGEHCKEEALAEAAYHGRSETVKLLLQAGADAAHDDSVALYQSIQRGNGNDVTRLLLEAGADATARAGTMLGVALAYGNGDAAKALLRHGADPTVYHRNFNAFEWATETGQIEFSAMLRQWMNMDEHIPPAFFEKKTLAELRAPLPGRNGRSGLHLAASSGAFDVICTKLITEHDGLTTADLLNAAPPAGPTLLDVLGRQGQLALAFTPKLWLGRKTEAMALYQSNVPAAFKPQVDLPAFAAALDQHTLRQKGQKFSLKP
ncbi:MAG: ankyrin repeat domain-containing protein [Micavibrio sp.]|nr:ankyrin repeat domain-containing protein [Micavibrio sp.]